MQIRNLIPVAAFIAIALKQTEAIATAFIFRTGYFRFTRRSQERR